MKRKNAKKDHRTVYDDVVSDVKFRLSQSAKAWADVVARLQFQLPVVDGDGIPSNVHLLPTLREATSLFCTIAQLYETHRLLTTNQISGRDRLLERARPDAPEAVRGRKKKRSRR